MKVYKQIINLLNQNGLKYRVIPHASEGRCDIVSQIRGNKLSQSMKAIVVKAQMSKKHSDYYLIVVPGDMALDMEALMAYTKAPQVFFAPKEKAMKLTNCEMGAIPPFAFNPLELKLIVDPAVRDNEEIVFNAGVLDHSIFMSTADYIRLVNPIWATVGKISSVVFKRDEEGKREDKSEMESCQSVVKVNPPSMESSSLS